MYREVKNPLKLSPTQSTEKVKLNKPEGIEKRETKTIDRKKS